MGWLPMGSHTDHNVGYGVAPYRIMWADPSVGCGVAVYGVTLAGPNEGLWGGCVWGHKLAPMWGYGVAPYGVTH